MKLHRSSTYGRSSTHDQSSTQSPLAISFSFQQSTQQNQSAFARQLCRHSLGRARGRLIGWLLTSLCVLLLTACGTAQTTTPDRNALLASTQQIAQQFASDNDLAKARAALDGLGVANINQWLILAAESAITDSAASPEAVSALIKLASASGLRSNPIENYIAEHNLVVTDKVVTDKAAPVAQGEPAVIVAPTDTATPIVASAPAAAQTVTTTTVSETVAVSPTLGSDPSANNPSAPITGTQTLSATAELSTTTELSPSAPLSQSAPITENLPTPTNLPAANPLAVAAGAVNLRGGPGTNYDLLGAVQAGESLPIVAKSPAGDWWQVNLTSGSTAWVFGQLVTTSGNVSQVAIAADIPPAPTPLPATAVPPTPVPAATAAPIATTAPIAEQPTAVPAAAAPTTPPVVAGSAFTVIEKRLWDLEENGGFLDGESVHCGEKRELRVKVVDAGGAVINNVQVQEIYGAQLTYVTGAQGKGDGMVEIILGEGQGVKVVLDQNGASPQSDIADGMTTQPSAIAYDVLRGARYCTSDESCRKFVEGFGCKGHFSWSVTFKRNY